MSLTVLLIWLALNVYVDIDIMLEERAAERARQSYANVAKVEPGLPTAEELRKLPGVAEVTSNAGVSPSHRPFAVVSYWWFVIPLTALSALLLLSKPPRSNQKKIIEPIPVEGA